MSEPFLSEIRMFGFNFAPRGWALCDGQILSINQNQSLYSLLGTNFGGDGRVTFGLPDLRGRSPRKGGSGATGIGEMGGAEAVAITTATMPAHTHAMQVNTASSDQTVPGGNFLGVDSEPTIYGSPNPASTVLMDEDAVKATGGGQAHNNMQPYQTISFGIALQGLFPSRT